MRTHTNLHNSMAFAANLFMLVGLLIITSSLDFTVAQIGVNYGTKGACLLSPSQVVALYKQYNIKRMRIYDYHQETLKALRGSGIELTVGIPNTELQGLDACAWVRDNILSYHPDVNFRHIVVGNEVRPGRPDTQAFVDLVLPAMKSVYNALPDHLRGSIKVTTSVDTGILKENSSFPPENGTFTHEAAQYLDPIVRFLVDTGAPLFASIYPYFAYKNNTKDIKLPYALLDPNYPGVETPSGTIYKNLFYAILDAVDAALEKCMDSMSLEINTDAGKVVKPEIKGAESGWPTKGKKGHRKLVSSDAAGDDAANIENARAYVNNLIQAVKNGTPRRPGKPIETYIFAMFDENLKDGDDEERHFGLFLPNGQPKYPVNFN